MIKLRRISFSYERGRRVLLFLFCLFLAFVVWSVHKLSGNFSTYFNYRVVASTQINGKYAEAVSENLLTLKVRAGGFYILKQKFSKDLPSLSLSLDYRQLRSIPESTGQYSLNVRNCQEIIREAIGESIEIEAFASDTLLFVFTKESSRKIPVKSMVTVRCKDGFGIVGNMLSPRDVTVYGEKAQLDLLDSIPTESVTIEGADSRVERVVKLILPQGVRASHSEIFSSVSVEPRAKK